MAENYTLASFDVHMRSKIDQYQMLILCENKFFGRDSINVVLKPLIIDLKISGSCGIDLGFSEKELGFVACLLGENLGGYLLEGFTTSFSNAMFMYRFCTVSRQEFLDNCICEEIFCCPESYD